MRTREMCSATHASGSLQSEVSSRSDGKRAEVYESALSWASRLALVMLVTMYARAAAAVDGSLWTDADWTISNVMVKPANQAITRFALFPAYLTICMTYGLKVGVSRVYWGSAVAIVGGVRLMACPVTTHPFEHTICALTVFLSSWFWYPECNEAQLRAFLVASVFFIGGALASEISSWHDAAAAQGTKYIPSVCCLAGELGIFVTWGYMVQHPLRSRSSYLWAGNPEGFVSSAR